MSCPFGGTFLVAGRSGVSCYLGVTESSCPSGAPWGCWRCRDGLCYTTPYSPPPGLLSPAAPLPIPPPKWCVGAPYKSFRDMNQRWKIFKDDPDRNATASDCERQCNKRSQNCDCFRFSTDGGGTCDLYATAEGGLLPPLPPPASPCAAWCERKTLPWSLKCWWGRSCAWCEQCSRLRRPPPVGVERTLGQDGPTTAPRWVTDYVHATRIVQCSVHAVLSGGASGREQQRHSRGGRSGFAA